MRALVAVTCLAVLAAVGYLAVNEFRIGKAQALWDGCTAASDVGIVRDFCRSAAREGKFDVLRRRP